MEVEEAIRGSSTTLKTPYWHLLLVEAVAVEVVVQEQPRWEKMEKMLVFPT